MSRSGNDKSFATPTRIPAGGRSGSDVNFGAPFPGIVPMPRAGNFAWPDASTTFDEPPSFFPTIKKSSSEGALNSVGKSSRPRHRKQSRSARSSSTETSPILRRRSVQSRRQARKDMPYSAPVTPLNSRPSSPTGDDPIHINADTGLNTPAHARHNSHGNASARARRPSAALTAEILAAAAQIVAAKKQLRAVEAARAAGARPTAFGHTYLASQGNHSNVPGETQSCDASSRFTAARGSASTTGSSNAGHSAVFIGPRLIEDTPQRLRTCVETLTASGVAQQCMVIPPRKATLEEIQLMHSQPHPLLNLALEKSSATLSITPFGAVRTPDIDAMREAAAYAAGCAIDVGVSVASGSCKNGFALVRPGGHMATQTEAHGFCVVNNVGILASYLLKNSLARRIMIVDWDVRHGKGLQDKFFSSNEVMYVSLHRYRGGKFYPHTGACHEVGAGPGQGFNVNIAWKEDESGGMTDSDYIAAFRTVVMPLAIEYEPDIILVAAGFNGAQGHPDEFGSYTLSPIGYAHLTQMLMSQGSGKVVLVLEGGSVPEAVANCVDACMRALMGQEVPPPPFPDTKPTAAAAETIQQVINVQRQFWPSLDNLAAFRHYSPSEFLELDRRRDEEQLDATATLASLHILSDPATVHQEKGTPVASEDPMGSIVHQDDGLHAPPAAQQPYMATSPVAGAGRWGLVTQVIQEQDESDSTAAKMATQEDGPSSREYTSIL